MEIQMSDAELARQIGSGDRIAEEFQAIVLDYVRTRYGNAAAVAPAAGFVENQL